MLHKTRGIVFRFTRYGDTSLIVTIFTELFGLQTYIVNGVRTSSSKNNKMALYQPLTLLELVVYYKENTTIKRIKEVRCTSPFHDLQSNMRKASIAMFMNEIMNKTVKEENHAQEIFEFLHDTLVTLDHANDRFENFHLVFLIKLSRYLGFGVHDVRDILANRIASDEEEQLLTKLIQAEYTTSIPITASQRRSLLDLLLKFYSDHLDTLGEIKSIQVLREVLG